MSARARIVIPYGSRHDGGMNNFFYSVVRPISMPLLRSFVSAKNVGESLARAELQCVLAHVPCEVLSNQYLEAEGCWIFFLNEQIPLPSKIQGKLLWTAYAVAKFGELEASVYDFRPNMEQMQDYLEMWSLHALGKKEEARHALEAFNAKYPTPNPMPSA